MTVTRGEGGWDNEGKVFSGTTIKDTWTKPRGRVEVREAGGFDWDKGAVFGEKCRQLLLNNNKIIIKNMELKWKG